MPKAGDNYTITVKDTYIKWGEERHTETRERIPGEVYFPIPANKAEEFEIFNSKKVGANIEYNVTTSDGFEINGKVKAQGVNSRGDGEYAKNLSGSGNLKLLGPWIIHMNIQADDKIKIEWTSATDIKFSKL